MKRWFEHWEAPLVGAFLTVFAASIWLAISLVGGCARGNLTAPVTKPLSGNAFEVVFTDSTGLGPLFNGTSCAECHESPNLGGFGDEIERVQLFTDHVFHEFPTPEPTAGFITLRTSNDLFGLGLLDQLSDDQIRAYVNSEPRFLGFADGRAWYNNPELRTLADGRLGRFGRKCQAASLRDFVAGAFVNELGIDSSEISAADLDATTEFVANLLRPPGKALPQLSDPRFGFRNFTIPPGRAAKHDSIPPQPPPDGAALFASIGCAMCHNPETSYTDLALHYVSATPDSGDGSVVHDTNFRTEPLVGLGLQSRFMHDGSSTTLEQAIAAHGREAGFSRAQFNHLSSTGQGAVLAFLRSL